MITDLLLNHTALVTFFGWLANALVEQWLGRTKATQAASVLDLIELAFTKIFKRRNAVTITSATTTAPVAKELKDWLDLGIALANDVQAGAKPADIALKEFGAASAALKDSDQIPQELKDDPVTFCRTAGGGIGEILGTFLKAWMAKPAAVVAPAKLPVK